MKKLKIINDILLLVVTSLLTNIQLSGRLIHEIMGITMFLLIFIHIALHWKWIKQVTKNFKKVNAKTKLMYIVDIFIMIIYLGAIILGISISNELLKLETASNFMLMVLHIILGRLSMIVMLVHIGLHISRKKEKIENE